MTPPFALTHAKYALIMFGPSLKSVPGCLVSIVPMLIGVPVAATPGFLPHDDVLVLPPLEPELAAVVALVLDALLASRCPTLVLLLLLPQPASTNAPTSAASAKLVRSAQRLVIRPHLLSSSSENDSVDPPRFGEATILFTPRAVCNARLT